MNFLFFLQAGGPENIPGWASLGVGGAIAVIVLYFYRQDRKDCEKTHLERARIFQAMAERVENVVKGNTDAHTQNAVSNVQLRGAVDALRDSVENRRRKYEPGVQGRRV